MAGAGLGQHVALPSPDEQDGQRQRPGRDLQPRLVPDRPGLVDASGRHEPGIPVPVPAAVLVLADVLAQAGEVGRPGPVRVVGGHGVGHLLQAREPLEMAEHEGADAGDARGFEAGCHVDEHQRACHGPVVGGARLGDGDDRADPPEGRADESGRLGVRAAHGSSDGPNVGGEGIEAVVAVGRPVAVAVPAQVDGRGAPALVAEQPGGAVPRVAGLPAAGEQQHGRTVVGPVGVRRQLEAVRGETEGDVHPASLPARWDRPHQPVAAATSGGCKAGTGRGLRCSMTSSTSP